MTPREEQPSDGEGKGLEPALDDIAANGSLPVLPDTQHSAGGVCETCNGHGLIGGWAGGAASIEGGGGYDAEPCPDCANPAHGGNR